MDSAQDHRSCMHGKSNACCKPIDLSPLAVSNILTIDLQMDACELVLAVSTIASENAALTIRSFEVDVGPPRARLITLQHFLI